MKIDDVRVPKGQDRRVKLTNEDREKVRALHKQGMSQRAIARYVGCSRRLVVFIIYPERYAHAKALYKERRKDGRYYDRNKHTEAMRKHRKHKKDILKTTNNTV